MGDTVRITYDLELKRPGCVLLAAALGGDPEVAKMFNSRLWLISPTPGLKTYNLPVERLEQLIQISEEANAGLL